MWQPESSTNPRDWSRSACLLTTAWSSSAALKRFRSSWENVGWLRPWGPHAWTVTDQNSHNSRELEPFSAHFGLPRFIRLSIYPQLSSYMIASTWQMALKWNTSCRVQTQTHPVCRFPMVFLSSVKSTFCFNCPKPGIDFATAPSNEHFLFAPGPRPPCTECLQPFHVKSRKKSYKWKKNVKSHLFNAKRKVRSSDFQTSKQPTFFLCLCSIFQNTIETSLKARLFFQSLYQHCSRNIEPDMDVINLYMFVLYLQAYKENQRKTSLFAYALAHSE